MSVGEFLAAAKVFIATSTDREFVSIVVSFVIAVISTTAAVIGYFSNRDLRQQVENIRDRLHEKEREIVRVEARAEERGKALDQRDGVLNRREGKLAKQEADRAKLLRVMEQSDEDFWTRQEPRIKPFEDFDARVGSRELIVALIANNKGGVGKSTLALNLAAYFNEYPLRPGKKRLLIDMDYQATLSYILTTACDITERESRSQVLLAQGATEATLFKERVGLDAVLPGCELVPAFYELGRHEDRLMMEWLLGDVNDDLRYRLASLLYRPDVASQYDMVIIDAPPRLTTGTVNGLCACTHLIVPTALTAASAEPVANFLAMAKAMKLKFNPNLKLVGVVETLTPAGKVGDAAKQARELARITVQRALRTHFPDASILERDIPRNNALAEEGIPYNDNQTIRGIIEQLGVQVRRELT